MLKKLATTLVVGSGLLLGACNTTTDSTQIAATVAQVRTVATQICGFVPDASALASLVGAFVPQVGVALPLADQIANVICNTATKLGASRNGIVITDSIDQQFTVTGHFRASGRRRH